MIVLEHTNPSTIYLDYHSGIESIQRLVYAGGKNPNINEPGIFSYGDSTVEYLVKTNGSRLSKN